MGSVNDLVIKIATVNGTGSASANGLLMKSIFRMGIPVVGKNYFPSNIQGLPTWYEVRVNDKGYLGRRGGIDHPPADGARADHTVQTWRHDEGQDGGDREPAERHRGHQVAIGPPAPAAPGEQV